MKINIKPAPRRADDSPSKLAADFAIKKLEKEHGRLVPKIPKMIRKACGDAETEAMNGGRGGWIELTEGLHLVRVKMDTIHEWEVEVYSKYA